MEMLTGPQLQELYQLCYSTRSLTEFLFSNSMRGFCFQITFKILQLCYFLVYASYTTFQLNYSNVHIFPVLNCSNIYTFQIHWDLPILSFYFVNIQMQEFYIILKASGDVSFKVSVLFYHFLPKKKLRRFVVFSQG